MSDAGRGIFFHVKSLGLIALVTMLIWLLAESESLRTEKVRVEIQFKTAPESGHLVRLKEPQDFSGSVSVRLEGSNARVDQLATAFRKSIRLEPGKEGVPLQSGEHSVNLESALRALQIVRDSGVSLSDVEPTTAIIIVDNLVTKDIPVKVVIPEGQLVDGTPEAIPATVQITYPESAAKDITTDLVAFARLDASSLATLPEGRRGSLTNISLDLPEVLWSQDTIRLTPPQVSVAVTLRSRVDVFTMPTVQVQLRLPVDAAGKYELDASTTELQDVIVVGPIDLIDQIKTGKLTPVATVVLSGKELDQAAASGQVLTKEPIFSEIPTPLSFESKQKVIRILVRKRETPSGPVPKNGN